MMSHCSRCGKDAIDVDESVCTACGVVVEGIDFGKEPYTSTSENTLNFKRYERKKPSAGLCYGLSTLDNLKSVYNYTTVIKEIAVNLFKDVYKSKSFARREDLGILAGCCLIHVMSERGQFVSLPNLCAKLGCEKKAVFKFSKLVKRFLNKTEGSALEDSSELMSDIQNNIPDGEENHLSDGSEDNPNIKSSKAKVEYPKSLESTVHAMLAYAEEESKSELIGKTISLTKLAYSCWLMTGRSLEGGITAASYLCWKSMHPSRRTLSFKKFCSHFRMSHNKAHPRVSELKDMLVKLGQKIPSFSDDYVNDKNVLFHLNYILENSETLRNDLLENEYSVDGVNKKEYRSFRKIGPRRVIAHPSLRGDSFDPDMCASDVEISDTEIDSYLRTDEQVETVKRLMKMKEELLNDVA